MQYTVLKETKRSKWSTLPTRQRDLPAFAPRFSSESTRSCLSVSRFDMAKDRRYHSMKKARRIQSHLLPDPAALREARVQVIQSPGEDVGGDYFDLHRLDDHSCIFCLADVTGHGVPAAMGAAMLKTLFIAAVEKTNDPGELLAEINHRFLILSPAEVFATVIIVHLDRRVGWVRYASAGHEPCYLLRHTGERAFVSSTGMPSGVLGASDWEICELAVHPGDRLVLVTDRVAETSSPSSSLFGRSRIEKQLDENAPHPSQVISERIMQTIAEYRGDCPAQDDVTVVIVEV